ncbi:MAG: molybdenum cofactor biosynthesis protein MoaE [Gemmatimonadota bacterium]
MTDASIRVLITEQSLDGFDPFRGLGSRADGAVVVFQGRVRDTNEGREVARLSYEAYHDMAESELRAICEEAAVRHEVGAIVAAHRVGTLDPGEVSVAIGVAAPHRASGYDASRYVIEQLKKRLPVWKHERYEDGTSTWVGAPAPGHGRAAEAKAEG